MLAARRLIETYLNSRKVVKIIKQTCESFGDYDFVWEIYQNFVKIDEWAEEVFSDLERMVRGTALDFLDIMKKKALEEIEMGRSCLKVLRDIEPRIISWCRKRHP